MGTYVANVQAKRLTATGTVFAGPARLLACTLYKNHIYFSHYTINF
jgi:hypothetical protein